MKIKGRAWKFGDSIDTDVILPGKYLTLTEPEELAQHAMEGIDPEFSRKVQPGDIIVAGRNFGCGSSREHAPLALKHAGVGAIVAKSFARIFFRNAVNIGLPVVICPEAYEAVEQGDQLEVDLEEGMLRNLTKGVEMKFTPLPRFLLEILSSGGLIPYLKSKLEARDAP